MSPTDHLRAAVEALVSPSLEGMKTAHQELLAAAEAVKQPGALASGGEAEQWRLWLRRATRMLHQAGAISFGAASFLFLEGSGYTITGRQALPSERVGSGGRISVDA